jgi:hypothetical protein
VTGIPKNEEKGTLQAGKGPDDGETESGEEQAVENKDSRTCGISAAREPGEFPPDQRAEQG